MWATVPTQRGSPNVTSILLRDQPYTDAQRHSVERRMAQAAREPRSLHDYLAWYRHEWSQELPGRIHERGVEPQSALGSPRLGGAFRAYIEGHPLATDHDDRLDVDRSGEARLFPVHAALYQMNRKWPLSARFLFAMAWTGAEWQDVALAWRMLPEVGHRFTLDALRHLWVLWARDAMRY